MVEVQVQRLHHQIVRDFLTSYIYIAVFDIDTRCLINILYLMVQMKMEMEMEMEILLYDTPMISGGSNV